VRSKLSHVEHAVLDVLSSRKGRWYPTAEVRRILNAGRAVKHGRQLRPSYLRACLTRLHGAGLVEARTVVDDGREGTSGGAPYSATPTRNSRRPASF